MSIHQRPVKRLAFCIALLAATLPFFGFDCFLGTIRKTEAGVEIHIENLGLDPVHFSHGSRNTRVAISESKVAAKIVVEAVPSTLDPSIYYPLDAQAGLKLKRMDIDLGTVHISIPGTELEAGKVTKFFIRMNEPEYFKFEFSCDNPAVGLSYQRP